MAVLKDQLFMLQPWVGLAGVVSTLLATFSAFGLLVFLGAEFTNFNYGAIFIMIGIGRFGGIVLRGVAAYFCFVYMKNCAKRAFAY